MRKFSISGMPENTKLPNTNSNSGDISPKSYGMGQKGIKDIAEQFELNDGEVRKIMETFKVIVSKNIDPDFISRLGSNFTQQNGQLPGEVIFTLSPEGLEMVFEYMTSGDNDEKISEAFEYLEFQDDDDDEEDPKDTKDSLAASLLDAYMKNKVTPGEIISKILNAFQNLKGHSFNNSSISLKNQGLDEIEEKKEEKRDNELHLFETLAAEGSFGVVPHMPVSSKDEMYNSFAREYGDTDEYDPSVFPPEMKGYNIIHAVGKVKKFKYLENNEKYILLLAIPEAKEEEPFAVAIIRGIETVFEIIVPEYGNTFNLDDGNTLSLDTAPQLYIKKENPEDLDNPKFTLKQPLNLDKVKVGLDIVLYEPMKPILSVKDFGEVFTSFVATPFTTRFIKIGRIKSNESTDVKMFKKDFSLNEDQILFDFYIRLKEEESSSTIMSLQKLLEVIDFNANAKIQSQEIKVDMNGNIYIDLDFSDILLKNIRKWKDEK